MSRFRALKERNFLGILFVFIGLLCGIERVNATTFHLPPLEERVKKTELILRGTVDHVEADWGQMDGGGRRIFTFVTLNVEEVLKGEWGSLTIMLRAFGGSKDGVTYEVPGAAQFRGGEAVVVFVGSKNEDGSYGIQSMSMGRFGLAENEQGELELKGPGLMQTQNENSKDIKELKKWTLTRLKNYITEVEKQSQSVQPASNSQEAERTDIKIEEKLTQNETKVISKEENIQQNNKEEPLSRTTSQRWKWILSLAVLGVIFFFFLKKI